ncbi:MAG TPA: response regulator transcription factor [Longimicrobiales bacterium]|nr:response regulator transcription factor [Longimicrobiales bacterium]
MEQSTARRRVLVLADRNLSDVVGSELGADGFEVAVFSDPAKASTEAERGCYDAFVVDVTLPDGAGHAFVAALRAGERSEPVLLLSGPEPPEDLLPVQRRWPDWPASAAPGVHDAPTALQALIRHERLRTVRRLRYVGITVDRMERRVCVDGAEMRVTPAEYGILECLLLHAEHVVPRADLIDAVWGPDPDLSSNALDVHIGHLRQKLAGAGRCDCIETVRRRGYMLHGGEPVADRKEAAA